MDGNRLPMSGNGLKVITLSLLCYHAAGGPMKEVRMDGDEECIENINQKPR
jgi:hypothetical protein